MIGARRYPEQHAIVLDPQPGDYWRIDEAWGATWYLVSPPGVTTVLGGQAITEHEDGTITLEKALPFTDADGCVLWHGWIDRGIWRELD